MNIREFVNKYGIKIVVDYANNNPNFADQNTPMNHYKVVLKYAKHKMTTYFSMGLGISGLPTAEDVLDCLALDAAGIENARNFEDWCNEYGYDTDSRKAEKIFKVCTKQALQLQCFLGDGLYKELLWDTEHL